jgi:hypothetical protein
VYRRLGGPQVRSSLVRKILPLPGFDARTVQLVASRYTVCAVPPLTAAFTEVQVTVSVFTWREGGGYDSSVHWFVMQPFSILKIACEIKIVVTISAWSSSVYTGCVLTDCIVRWMRRTRNIWSDFFFLLIHTHKLRPWDSRWLFSPHIRRWTARHETEWMSRRTNKVSKVKFPSYYRPRKPLRENRGIALLFFVNIGTVVDGGGWSTPRPGRLYPERDPVPIVQEAGWA